MTISSVTAVAPGRGFTPCRRGFSNPAVTSTVSVGRQGLSLHHSRQHQREIPVRQAGQYGGGPVLVPVEPLMRIQVLIEGDLVTATKQCPFYIEADE
jgi:hypothetical protein